MNVNLIYNRLYKRKKGYFILDVIDVSRAYIRKFIEKAAKETKKGSIVLDVGAGERIWQHLFKHCDYKTQDKCVGEPMWNYSKIDYKSDATKIPIEDSVVDVVILTQVLEHIPEPECALREMNRILKNHGKIYITVPLGWREHETPYDFYRYTSFGIKYLLEKTGFKLISLEKQGGYFKHMGMKLWAFIQLPFMNRNNLLTTPLKLFFVPCLTLFSLICYVVDGLDKEKEMTLGFMVVAEKKK